MGGNQQALDTTLRRPARGQAASVAGEGNSRPDAGKASATIEATDQNGGKIEVVIRV
jgi:hypothetical protein